ncbi:uncharacterized protein LOC132751018 [Ruditapes philippinarum]|uniref:uncharacterized protein LOC132751018 n=1 Tax=Ruditapes philippinarum TaxID=129788 RepID=UPI00295BEEB8|nr:uncharacterized protein LOC132751018 [Ruditapes philippinarum]
MDVQIIAFLIFCVGLSLGENTHFCENSQSLSEVRIPAYTLTQEDFDNNVAGATLKQAYILLPDPAPFTVSSNYNCMITKIDATTYQRVCTGLEPACTEYILTLTATTQGNMISFPYTDPNNNVVNEYYWSPCPSKFILRMQCSSDSFQVNQKCALSGARITVFLVGDVNLNNAPWTDISHEIFTATGVKFGEIEGMNWYFTENTGTPCVP